MLRLSTGNSSTGLFGQREQKETEAEIANTNAQYQYRLTLAALNFQTGAQP
ncbi:MAG: hypothetical protein ACJ71S_13815 [Acidobacteriaceae bacterium]